MPTWKKLLPIAGISILLVGSCVAIYYAISLSSYDGPGTTNNLEQIILERCSMYREKNQSIRHEDCIQIWQALTKAATSKDPCSVTQEDYAPLLELTDQKAVCNKVLLWSKTKQIAHCLTKENQQYITLEDTFLGFLFDDLTWCGRAHKEGFNFTSCPTWKKCVNNTITSFWKMASASFARNACGLVTIMLNGSAANGIVDYNSILWTVEIPHLNPLKVSEVQLWLIDDRDLCSSEPVLKLRKYIEQKGLKYSCSEYYRPEELERCIKEHVL
ncbi:ADP-ribosyl cyclase/cyclic ADP-ribose hydrolase 1 [Bombina bombina]|uniref:ADP-ribosyl cyclase/cyclic ADP-ribose hydrolase 1 n=1 Tax=Bombina bombina TaxID=8345 RepID=UPI00235B01CC|nr:ADP-ribosyl cyclase/cyclic ADP-ribose hydrolase 1 [Bombina bombina]